MEILKNYYDLGNAWLTENFGDLGPLLIIGVLGMFLVLLTLPVLLKKEKDPFEQLKKDARAGQDRGDGPRLRRGKGRNISKLDKYSSFLEPQDEKQYSDTRLKLLQAGYRSKDAVRTYHFLQFFLGIVFLSLGALYAIYSSVTGEPSLQALMGSVLIPGIAGYMLPKYWVTKRQQSRQEEITNGFPDSLDMMLVCVEAGQSLDQSIVRVAKEMHASSEMRDKRIMRAEEKANTLPTKMTLATMMLTVPPLLIILIGPSVYDIAVTLGSMSF